MTGRDRESIERLIATFERMRLGEYVTHVSRRGRFIWDNMLYGLCGGWGSRWASRCWGAAGGAAALDGDGQHTADRRFSGGGHSCD